MNALENIVCVLNREVERSSVTLEAFSHQHRLDQEKIENLSNKVRQLERTLTMRDLQLSETEQMLRELQFCTYDGIFVWKIYDFSRRRQDAVAGRTPAMFSPGKMKDALQVATQSPPIICLKALSLHVAYLMSQLLNLKGRRSCVRYFIPWHVDKGNSTSLRPCCPS